MKDTVYGAIKRKTAEFLSDVLALQVDVKHIICPSLDGNIAATVLMVYKLSPDDNVLKIINALEVLNPTLYGERIIDGVWHKGGYINFSLKDEFIIQAARKVSDDMPSPVEIFDVTRELDYALARAAMIYDHEPQNICKARDNTPYISALWYALGMPCMRDNREYKNSCVRAAIDTLTGYPLYAPDFMSMHEYCEILMKLLSV